MKELQQFQCEICNTVYKSKTECIDCEKSHSTPVKFANMKYSSYKSDGSYPLYIEIVMSDGKVIRYKK